MLNKVLLLALLVSITAIADDPLAELKSAAILAEQSGLPEVFATCSGTLLAMAEIAKDARKKELPTSSLVIQRNGKRQQPGCYGILM